jgi:hypothetical protein
LSRKPNRKRKLGRPKTSWEDKIKAVLTKEILRIRNYLNALILTPMAFFCNGDEPYGSLTIGTFWRCELLRKIGQPVVTVFVNFFRDILKGSGNLA